MDVWQIEFIAGQRDEIAEKLNALTADRDALLAFVQSVAEEELCDDKNLTRECELDSLLTLMRSTKYQNDCSH